MKRVEGKVALITGAARGQGRAEALALAEEGADLILVDIAGTPAATDYAAATEAELAQTVADVEKLGRRVIHTVGDVRDLDALEALVAKGVSAFGRLDIVVANAGIVSWGRFWEMDRTRWQDMIDINLTGVFNTMRAAVPSMIASDNGGSIIATSSVSGLKSLPGQAHYSSAKAGVVGLVKSAAIELAPYRIRVNSIHPWGVRTPMGEMGPDAVKVFADNPSYQAAMGQYWFDPPISEPEDIARAVLFLASDDSRTVTGIQLPVDHGASKI
ncbi:MULTISPECIES: mycofactocin-coupled SDR family oxidoreductase [Nocardiaceae]|uniref:SDR family mycofactocin-dependent oxidoreductase n=1 Tax=Rhodococcoides corynebacterioides TaxID=53972 RepID=A0ABS2L0M5_9NOCA|nr:MULTISPECIES: mycofactocin-coupled SDR family oxidoreductase [Rhodococcus]MBM7417440.1 SDR family mycofactocin-dependent oxidoreductase [Rhodococcus corynebacterioides]MBP1115694.1 SDR family mycofactocin-dependent oxidoreductase [Rhodococcus sp. PvP016]